MSHLFSARCSQADNERASVKKTKFKVRICMIDSIAFVKTITEVKKKR